MTIHNRIPAGKLALVPEHTARALRDRRELRAAYLGQVAELPSRPEPRDRWDNQGRSDADLRYRCPGWQEVEDARAAMRAAIATGDPTVLAATKRRIEAFAQTWLTLALAECPVEAPSCLTSAFLTLTKEAGEATHAAAVAHVERSPSAWERARTEAREAASALSAFMQSLAHHDPMRAAR